MGSKEEGPRGPGAASAGGEEPLPGHFSCATAMLGPVLRVSLCTAGKAPPTHWV